MNRSIWKLGVVLMVLLFIAVPVTLAVVHGTTQTAHAPLSLPAGGGMSVAIVAGGMYAGKRMGNGNPIPATASGAPDINALIGQMVDRGLWWYYYTLKLAAGATLSSQYTLFNAAVGSPDPYPLTGTPVLTKVETNMPNTSNNGFNAPRDLVLDQLGFKIQESALLSDIITFDQYSYFELKIIDKIFYEGKISWHPMGTGISGFSTKTSESSWLYGSPNQSASVRFGNFAKYIAPQMNWSLVLYFPPTSGPSAAAPVLATSGTGGQGVTLVTFLKGLTDRAVQ
jgi:hypothetical protein